MAHDRMRHRLGVFLVVAGLLFTALAGRIVYLNEAFARTVTSGGDGVDLEVLHEYPVPDKAEPTAASGTVRVPSVRGTTFDEAGAKLWQAGLHTEGLGAREGRVVRQEPAAGKVLRPGDTVRVWLEAVR
ncbi:MAG TPA: PASTA domain-containing protein [Symbiobacteriaceae bacterium]|nr:PASTA domain-containing protein [Symbiobacteriaceae bacterium]